MSLDKIRRRSYASSQGLPAGTTFDFDYTGTVQEVELPKGRYKLQCWGAQGGNHYMTSTVLGSKGGYSEGVLNIVGTTKLYAFVGGQGDSGSNNSSYSNGGWNGGGYTKRYTSYGDSSDSYGYSHCYVSSGGGATDFATVTSDMNYSSYVTNRNSESLLSRCIVAGGGSGGCYNELTKSTPQNTMILQVYNGGNNEVAYTNGSVYLTKDLYDPDNGVNIIFEVGNITRYDSYGEGKDTFVTVYVGNNDVQNIFVGDLYPYSSAFVNFKSYHEYITGFNWIVKYGTPDSWSYSGNADVEYMKLYSRKYVSKNTTTISNMKSQGGGTSGKGQYPGTQSSAGNGGKFGYGGSITYSNYRFSSGAGGGGWYGGGTEKSNTTIDVINYSGGGSGFVNISSNSSYRPSGYTGLELESGTTIDGSQSFPTIANDGTTEIGHAGNGYARITAL